MGGVLKSIDEMYHDWLMAGKPITSGLSRADEGEWEPDKLHISDIGQCPRKVMLRVSGAEKRPVLDQTLWNQERMFDDAKEIHSKVYQALDHAGVLLKCEFGLSGLPDYFTGHGDILADIDGVRVVDVKTPHPGYWRREDVKAYIDGIGPMVEPQEHYAIQVAAYHFYEETKDKKEPLLYTRDRGGSNTSLQIPVDVARWVPEMLQRKAALCNHYEQHESSGWIPEPLVRQIAKKGKTKVVLGPPWDCEYCDYQGQSCAGPSPLNENDTYAPMEEISLYYKRGGNWQFSGSGTYFSDEVGAVL